MKKLLCIFLLLPALVWADEGYPLDKAPDRSNDLAALQHGAKLFVNYCLNCHGASSMRYNRLKDIGLTDEEIKQNLLFTTDKVGETMTVAMKSKDAKVWFGAVPPDLSVIARAKSSERGPGADYIYTYMRTFYKDEARPTGWNNMVFPNVGMPHVLWQLQGVQKAVYVEKTDPHEPNAKPEKEFEKFDVVTPGTMSKEEYDVAAADLTGFLSYMAEPVQTQRHQLGVIVLLFLFGFFVIAWRLNASFWKDVK